MQSLCSAVTPSVKESQRLQDMVQTGPAGSAWKQEIPEFLDSGSGEEVRGPGGGVRLSNKAQFIYGKHGHNRAVDEDCIGHKIILQNKVLKNKLEVSKLLFKDPIVNILSLWAICVPT